MFTFWSVISVAVVLADPPKLWCDDSTGGFVILMCG